MARSIKQDLDDQIAVFRMEGTALEDVGLGGLDAQAEMDHRVDLGMRGEQIEHLGHRVPRLAARQIDGVAAAPARGNHAVDARNNIV